MRATDAKRCRHASARRARSGIATLIVFLLGCGGCQSKDSEPPKEPAEVVRTDPAFWIEIDAPTSKMSTTAMFELKVIARDVRQDAFDVEKIYPNIVKYSWSVVRNHKPEKTLVFKGAEAQKGRVVLAGAKRLCPSCAIELIDQSLYEITVVATNADNRSSVGGTTTFCIADDDQPCPR